MQLDWMTVLIVQVLIGLIVLFEWKQLKEASKVDRIIVAVILISSATLSLFNLENLPGPITFLNYLLDPLTKILE